MNQYEYTKLDRLRQELRDVLYNGINIQAVILAVQNGVKELDGLLEVFPEVITIEGETIKADA